MVITASAISSQLLGPMIFFASAWVLGDPTLTSRVMSSQDSPTSSVSFGPPMAPV